jgi:hypothetical protein
LLFAASCQKIQLFKKFGMIVTKITRSWGLKFGIFISIHKACNFTQYH